MARSSRHRYKGFVEDYRHRRLDDDAPGDAGKKLEAKDAAEKKAVEKKPADKKKHRQYIREYLRWLKPHRYALGFMFVLALLGGALEMVEPLFMRYMIDRVLLNRAIDDAARFIR